MVQLKGVITGASSVEEAVIVENAGTCCGMALDMIPSRIRKQGVAIMSKFHLLKSGKYSSNGKMPSWLFTEAKILENLNVDFINESEVLTPADYEDHINKK